MPCWHLALYDDFAWFYNRYWNEEFHGLAFPILERIWLPRVAPKGRVLDVCCGTGYLAGLLAARGYRVTGIDASAEMIAHARENVPGAAFQVADASRFRVLGKFDGAVSTFDSLNHILREEDLEAAFQRTAAALKTGAPFAFDMLLESAYQTNWADAFSLVRDDHVLVLSGSGFDFRTRLAQCKITMFRLLDGVWRRSDVEVRERCYTTSEIDTALSRAGFEETACYDARDLGMSGQLGQGRTFVVTTRATRRAKC
jgi:SAM-dependent methyltransferase